MIESGYPDFDMTGGMGVFAPAATPKEAVDRLSAEIIRVVQLPEVRTGLEATASSWRRSAPPNTRRSCARA